MRTTERDAEIEYMLEEDIVAAEDLTLVLKEIIKLGDQHLYRRTRTALLNLLTDFAKSRAAKS